MEKERFYTFCLILILIFCGFIYFYKLGEEGLSTDEYFSLYAAGQPISQIILANKNGYNPNTIPPLYFIIMHFWMAVFGSGEFAERALSAMLGIASVYALYRLTRLLFDARTGIIAALFGSLSYVWFCTFRLNRCYSLFLFLALLSFYIFFYYLKNNNSKFSLPILIAINTALIYTHYFAFLIILLELLIGILERKRLDWGRVILPMCICVFLAYIPWYGNLFYDISREPLFYKRFYFDIWRQLAVIVMILFSDFHVNRNVALTILYIPLIAAGFISLEKNSHFRNRLLFLTLIFTIPLIIIYAFTLSPRVRYYAPFSFPLLILLALGIQRLKKPFLIPLVSLIVILNLTQFYGLFADPVNEKWKQAAQYIKGIPGYQNKDMVFIFQTRYNEPVFAYYYWDNKIARSFVNRIYDLKSYNDDLIGINTRHRVYHFQHIGGAQFFEMLNSFPGDTWFWIFMYNDQSFLPIFRMQNNDRYFFHKINLCKETPLPQINLYLLKKIK